MIGFPLLLIPLAIYNIIVLLMPSVSFADPLVRLTLVSGSEWSVTLSDLLLALGILMLLLEVFKGAGHMLMLERTEEVHALITEFARDVSARAPLLRFWPRRKAAP